MGLILWSRMWLHQALARHWKDAHPELFVGLLRGRRTQWRDAQQRRRVPGALGERWCPLALRRGLFGEGRATFTGYIVAAVMPIEQFRYGSKPSFTRVGPSGHSSISFAPKPDEPCGHGGRNDWRLKLVRQDGRSVGMILDWHEDVLAIIDAIVRLVVCRYWATRFILQCRSSDRAPTWR